MAISPIQGFQNLSTPKKVAAVAVPVAAAAAVGLAYAKGKNVEGVATNDKGKAKFFSAVKEGFKLAWAKVKNVFAKKTEKAAAEAPKSEAAGEAAAGKGESAQG